MQIYKTQISEISENKQFRYRYIYAKCGPLELFSCNNYAKFFLRIALYGAYRYEILASRQQ
jgi:hypothetical protein